MASTYRRLLRNIEINHAGNVVTHQLGLWDEDDVSIAVDGVPGLAFSVPVGGGSGAKDGGIKSITINTYIKKMGIDRVGLVMLDTEGGEERALKGASSLIRQDGSRPLISSSRSIAITWTGRPVWRRPPSSRC